MRLLLYKQDVDRLLFQDTSSCSFKKKTRAQEVLVSSSIVCIKCIISFILCRCFELLTPNTFDFSFLDNLVLIISITLAQLKASHRSFLVTAAKNIQQDLH